MIYEVIENAEMQSKIIKATKDDGSVIFIPTDSGNSDYQAYLEFLNDDTETE